MKIKGIMLAIVSLLGMGGVFAQAVEYDDMYFNSRDRKKLNEQKASGELVFASREKLKKVDEDQVEATNPTDSYSARNINPEYTSRAQTQSAQDDEDYFVNNYQYNRNQYNNWNNNFNQGYNDPWYRSNYYYPRINSRNSPYYGYNSYGYNSYNSPWYDPMWSYNGWSSSFGLSFGNSWNYGWGGNYNYWNQPYYGYDPYFGGGYGYGGGYWNNYRYPGTIVVINGGENGGRKMVYGKRPTRGNALSSNQAGTRTRTTIPNAGRVDNSGRGRTQQDYYNRSQRTNSSNSTFDNRSNTQNNRSRSWGDYNSNSSGRSSTPSYSPSQNSSSGASRSSGSGTNGRSRGRD
jgi:hypothetical protein